MSRWTAKGRTSATSPTATPARRPSTRRARESPGAGAAGAPPPPRRSLPPVVGYARSTGGKAIVITDRENGPWKNPEEFLQLRKDLVRAVDRVCPRWLKDRSDDLVQVALMRVMEIQRKKEGTAEFSSF